MLTPKQKALLQALMPGLRISLPATELFPLAPAQLFDGAKAAFWLEIGFGSGEHMVEMARCHPDIGFMGCEYFVNGIASLVSKIDEFGLKNIRIFDNDARRLLGALAPGTIDRVFLLHPDPWPKKRHAKRRFVCEANLNELARVMKSGALFHITSDHEAYVHWTFMQLLPRSDFEWAAEKPSDWRAPPGDWPDTRYQKKARRAGRLDSFLEFRFTGQH